jgi:protein-disulfide isomerase
MKTRLDSAITTIFLVCALATTGAIIHREFFATPGGRAHAEQKSLLINDWRTQLTKGVRMGPEQAPVQLMEFADFECPYCGSFHQNLKILRARYPTQMALTYMHFPLPGHRFAIPAARVAECADNQGRFEAMYDQLFEGQESFGLKPWRDFAAAAGVPDLEAFDACIKKTDPLPRVEEGKQLGTKLDIQGTPTVIVNGWKLGKPPSAEELDGMVRLILAGKSPIPGRT